MLAKSMQKHAGRAKEKILHNLGKVDRTADDIFDDHLNNFNRQQLHANRLQKEFNSYIRCIRAVQGASKSLMDAINEIYEPHWSGYDALQAQTAASESLWLDFAHKLADQVLIPLTTYTGQFPEMKKKIEKRNRKLIDYDGQRHSFQNLQASTNKRKDEGRLNKGREQLEEARRTYEILNTELHDELPALYDSRLLFLVTNLQTLFGTEQVFHNETAKIYAELEAIVDRLATESQRGSNTLRKQATLAIKTSPLQSPVKPLNNATLNNSNYQNEITTNGASNADSPTSTTSSQIEQQEQQQKEQEQEQQLPPLPPPTTTTTQSPQKSLQEESRPDSLSSVSSTPESTPENQTANNNTINQSITTTATTATTAATTTTTTVPKTPSSPIAATLNASPKQPSYQDLSEIVKEEIVAVTATTKETPKRTNSNANREKLNAQAQTQAQEHGAAASDVAMNNVANDENTTKTTSKTTVTTTTIQETKKTTPQQLPTTEQLNGNNKNEIIIGDDSNKSATLTATEEATATTTKINNGNIEDTKNSIGDATTTDLPPGVLYRVKATYGYVKEDVDELSFEIGDIIRVIEYDDPEDQEEGWLMGQKEGTNEKGLFPANFTRPI